MEQFKELGPVWQALIGGCFTWGLTAAGAAMVFAFKTINRKVMDGALGFAAGIMIAASYWSLLAPAIEMSEGLSVPIWFPAAAGFLGGGVFLRICDKLIPHLHLFSPMSEAEGIATKWKKSVLLVLAITLHNIPEGLAVGVAFGSAALHTNGYTLSAAIALAIGIGLQNFPEGMAVSIPLRREGLSRLKSFNYGQLSGMVEPIACVIGAATVVYAAPILPYALAFAAGAMIFVVVEEAIPESQQAGNADIATMGAMIGFTVMMIMDVALG
ncbi:MAG: ZIP family metal transporter [Phycisphaerae bacterium]|nr:ZIP family metal transporter [Phycisphaerae bacterium]